MGGGAEVLTRKWFWIAFVFVSLFVVISPVVSVAAPELGESKYHGIKWRNPNIPFVLQQYDQIAEKPGSAEWVRKAATTG